MIWRQNSCFIHCNETAFNSFFQMILEWNWNPNEILASFTAMIPRAFNSFFSNDMKTKLLHHSLQWGNKIGYHIIVNLIGMKSILKSVLFLCLLLLQSGIGVMERLTRPLHVPYSIGLPYSYTTPSCTRPTSNFSSRMF